VIFESPLWLLGLLALPVLAGLEGWLVGRDRERTARLVARALWPRVLVRPAERWRFVRLALFLLGAAGVALALARPQWGIVREKVEREGVDVVLVLDTSGSMATEDVSPNRFFLAKQALSALISRLEGDRFGLVAFEGEAYPLVPLTLDADALGLFLETVEPGIVPAPGTSVGVGLAKGLDLFVDKDRHNRVMVLVSDGEDLEGDVEEAVVKAREAGVVVHTVGVGTEAGQPVPDFDREGRRVGFKRDASGTVVVSRLNPATLDAIARGTGGKTFRITPADTSLSALASAIEGIEQKTLAREFSYRRKERFQVPLAIGLLALALGLLLPLPSPRRRGADAVRAAGRAAAALLLLAPGAPARAQTTPATPAPSASPAPERRPGASVVDEILLKPRRLTEQGRAQYAGGSHPQALSSFEEAARTRPQDPSGRFNVADGLYKNGKFEEAATLFRSLGEDPRSPLAAPARFNLGNALFQKQDYGGAIQAYRDALRAAPDDMDVRRNLELALRALKEQEEQKKKDQQNQKDKEDQKKDQKDQQQSQSKPGDQQKKEPGKPEPPKTPEQKQDERFRQEAGMPRERAMQLLDALQQNEKAEQRKLLQAKRAEKKGTKDW
jgi:Ca-activated chloride channel homolog